VETHGLPKPFRQVRSYSNTTTTEVKIKELRYGAKIIRPYRKYPLVESVNLIKNKNIKLLLKLKGNNPGGSLKDRAAYNMIISALERGDIKKEIN
jgi:threonine synthase